VQQWIRLGAVQVNGQTTAASRRLGAQDQVDVWPQPLEADQAFEPFALELDVAFEDHELMVVNKPAGLVVHPAPGHWQGTLMNALLHARPRLAELPRAGIVHRLDRDTSGLLIVAKNSSSLVLLQQQLAQRLIHRVYLAFVHGSAEALHRLSINTAIGRDPVSRVRMACEGLSARPALTHVMHLQSHPETPGDGGAKRGTPTVSMLSCKLESGRTHQIRVHLASRGHRLLGDPLYGAPALDAALLREEPSWVEWLSRGQALHAALLVLEHPHTRKVLAIHRPWSLAALLKQPEKCELCRLWGLEGV